MMPSTSQIITDVDSHQTIISDDDEQNQGKCIIDSAENKTHSLIPGPSMKIITQHLHYLTATNTPIHITHTGILSIPTNNGTISTKTISTPKISETLLAVRELTRHNKIIIFTICTHCYSKFFF